MPPYDWQIDPVSIIQNFEARHNNPDAGALLIWAVSTVDCLYYLDDLDQEFNTSGSSMAGHRPDVIDVAHARWATSSAITSLDLCAAGLGRVFCANTGTHELDVGDFNAARRAQLPPLAQQWLDRVRADSHYYEVKSARDWLTHSRLRRHFSLSTKGPRHRIKLEFNATQLPVRDLIELARELATWHVSGLFQILDHI
jgi:hypothetical protein